MKIPKNLEIRFVSDDIGYGVFTSEPIKEGDVVEICYCLIYKHENINWALNDYLFKCTDGSDNIFLPLGYGAIYNHNQTPNLMCTYSTAHTKFVSFISLRDIKSGEELTQDYGNGYWNHRKKRLV